MWERLAGSFHSKATGLLDGREQLLVELLVALVGRNVDPVEAGMSFRQIISAGINLVYCEESWACSTLERLEALQRHPRGAGHELQQPRPPLLVEELHSLPEPLDDVAVGGTVF